MKNENTLAYKRDIESAKAFLRRMAHRPLEEQTAILKDRYGKRATPGFVNEVMA